jgi:hypothetical protein
MVADAARVIALDRVERGDRVAAAGGKAGLFRQFPPRAFDHRLAQFLDAARKAPAPAVGLLGPAHQQEAVAAADDRKQADHRRSRIITVHGATMGGRRRGVKGRSHDEERPMVSLPAASE